MKIRSNGASKKANTQPTLKTSPKKPLLKKQQSLTVINIRESGYKILRSRSNRTEHSLQTKQPIKIAKELRSSSKQQSMQKDKKVDKLIARSPPSHVAPYTFTNEKQYNTAGSDARKHHHTFTTLKEQPSHDRDTYDPTFTKKWTTHSNKDHQQLHQQQHSQVECLKIIWHNVKILKTNLMFRPEVFQLQKNIERILLKIAEDEHCLTTDRYKIRKDIKTTNESDNVNIHSARIQELFNNNEGKSGPLSIHESLIQEKKMAYMIEEQVDSYKGSFDSLRIENQESHKYEFLNLYDRPSSQRSKENLKDITNIYLISAQSSDRNCIKERESTVRFSERSESQREERLDLRSIIKQAKRSRVDEHSQEQKEQPTEVTNTCCDKITKRHQKVGNMDILTYSCSFLDCDFSKKEPPSSSGSSQSKRQVLNQIISMLNHKYQKTIKIDFNKSLP